jgi:hypothetical protein
MIVTSVSAVMKVIQGTVQILVVIMMIKRKVKVREEDARMGLEEP